MNIIKTVLLAVAFFLVGGALGWLVNWGMTRVQVAELERDNLNLEKQIETVTEQWELAVNELSQTKVLLNDTLSALELLRQYQAVNRDVQEDVQEIRDTLDPEGNVTPETEDKFRNMIDEFNRLQGRLVTNTSTFEPIDITPFIDLRHDAEVLFQEAQELLLEIQPEEE